MGRTTLGAAIVVAMMGSTATASIPATGDAAAIPPAPALEDTPVPAQRTDIRPPCVWRFAFRPPSRLYFGCRFPDTLEASTAWIDLDPQQLSELTALANAIASGQGHEPVTLPAPAPQRPTLCDRYWLWAADEGPRAPDMTRARKIAQACGDDTQAAAMRDN